MHTIAHLHNHDVVIVHATCMRTCNCAGQHPLRRSRSRDESPPGRTNIGVYDVVLVFAPDFWRFVAVLVSRTLESRGRLAIWLTHLLVSATLVRLGLFFLLLTAALTAF